MEMSQDNTITVRGYVTAEPKMWQRTPEQSPVATIRVGSTPRKLNRETGEWQDGETSYYSVKCWRKLAENVHGSLRKGDMVIVRGKVFTRSWLDDQQRVRMEVQIEADSVGHDLAFGWSRFNRGVHTPPSVLEGLANGEAVRHGMAPDPDLPGAGDAQFADGQFTEGQFAEDQFAEDEVSSDGGPGDPLSAQDNQAFASLTSDLDQPAEAATPF
jgi:single-strand DNA-binding protein